MTHRFDSGSYLIFYCTIGCNHAIINLCDSHVHPVARILAGVYIEKFDDEFFIGWLWEPDRLEMAFKPYGKPPHFDLDEYKDSFELWEAQWEIFLDLSTINTALDAADRPKYKAQLLKGSMSKTTLAAILSSGMTAAELIDPAAIIAKLRERCNAGRNQHVWRQTFTQRKQRENEPIDDWLCDLRDLARKCEFAKDCCGDCEPTRLLGQVVFGVQNDDDRRKLLEKGATLTLDAAITLLRTTEAATKQSLDLRGGDEAVPRPEGRRDVLHPTSQPIRLQEVADQAVRGIRVQEERLDQLQSREEAGERFRLEGGKTFDGMPKLRRRVPLPGQGAVPSGRKRVQDVRP